MHNSKLSNLFSMSYACHGYIEDLTQVYVFYLINLTIWGKAIKSEACQAFYHFYAKHFITYYARYFITISQQVE